MAWMAWSVRWACALGLLAAGGCRDDDDDPTFTAKCVALPRLPSPALVVLERVFSGVDVEGGVALVEHPTEARFYLVVKSGQVYTFTAADSRPELVLDMEDALMISGEAGLLDLEFHPEFATNGALFLSYNAPGGTGAMLSRVSRFTMDADGTIDRATESIVLEVDQPYTNHNGGDIGFGPDGFLYFGLGDGGSAGDPQGNGQNTDTVLGAMLRVDVDAPPAGAAYGIPPDNPFAQGGGAPEIFAWGFRNPWRWSFDRTTGDLWVGDVGQHRWEEVDRVVLGGNYGWGLKEGPDCIGVDACAGDFIDPVAAYRNAGTASVVGGAVLRGGSIPPFEGSYVFSDFYDGTIWRVPIDVATAEPEPIGSGADGVAAWTLAHDGTLYGTRYRGGIVRLVEGAPTTEPDTFPRKLSETGCVDVEDPAALLPWTVGYDVNLAFWSDGADKQRFVAVPEGERGDIDAASLVQWPEGTVLGKSFWIDDRPVETRLLVRDDAGWVGYGYAWDADGRDATLVEDERTTDDGWVLPGLRGCPACHTEAAGGPLGTTLAQLDRDVTIDDVRGSQLDRFEALGILSAASTPTDPLPRPDDDVSVDVRARAYLHVNCSPCHREEGTGGRADLDLRREVPLADTGLCDVPDAGELGLVDPRIVAPGEPDRSILLTRIVAPGDARMPPLATAAVDEAAVTLIRAWIQDLDACP
jgi:uncharacterized repeat protein (TIGR03806 family)